MNASKKILFISGFRIFPGNTGGHVHSSGIVRSLARMGYRVLVYSLAGRQGDYGPKTLLRPSNRVDSIETNLIEETNLGLTFGLLQAIGRRLDYPRVWQHELLRRAWVPGRLKHALREADIIISDMPWCPKVPGPWFGKPWFLISHNLEHVLLEQATLRQRRFAPWMLKCEREAPAVYRDIFPCAESDRDFFRSHDRSGKLRLPIIRCGVDPGLYAVPAGTRNRVRAELGLGDADRLLVFSGSRFGPNVEAFEALREFSRVESEFLRRERVYILILGSVVAAPFREGFLIATGRVADVAPYFAAGDAGLNPVVRGSGANVKLFEYLATRLPVISTIFGVRGMALQPDVDFLAYEPNELKATIERFKRRYSREQWRAHADAVWVRHRESCDIGALVESAVAQIPEFHAS
jgi:hypothetical protein